MLLRDFPNTLVHTSGPYVGLPEGQMGNSEVGHLNIGAGRVVQMDVTRIDMMIANGEFFANPVLHAAMHHARSGHRLHLMGLCSDGGVHSQLTHLYALLKMARREGVEQRLRALLHGWARYVARKRHRLHPRNPAADCARSVWARSRRFQAAITPWIATSAGNASIARSRRWWQVRATKFTDPVEAMQRSYEKGVTDEFIEPVTIVDAHNEPVGLIRDDDACIFFNYRADRGREMTEALTKSGKNLVHSRP